MSFSLSELIDLSHSRVNALCQLYLEETASPAPTLQQAMHYALSNGGKRIRPLLVYLVGSMLGAPLDDLDAPAMAIELIHSYSLIHDDLPAMDNADLRRGKPTCHKIFSDAIAILAGDALQPLAFKIIASHPSALTTGQRLKMIDILCDASGMRGMAAGQTMDMIGVDSLDALNTLYSLKTAALLTASVKLGIIAANINDKKTESILEQFAENIGLAFQIQDDLLDIESKAELIGKPTQLDSQNKKRTYPFYWGVEESRRISQTLLLSAMESLRELPLTETLLHDFVEHMVRRQH